MSDCKHEFVLIAICSGHEGSTIISKCRWCGVTKEDFTSSDELKLFAVTQQRIKTQKMLGTYKEPITLQNKGNPHE